MMPEAGVPQSTRTWRPATAGILSIVAGAITMLMGAVIGLVGQVIAALAGYTLVGAWAAASPFLVLGAVSIAGGVFALRRRAWGMALAGAISALFPFVVPGVLSIVFVALAKEEFS